MGSLVLTHFLVIQLLIFLMFEAQTEQHGDHDDVKSKFLKGISEDKRSMFKSTF